MSSPRKPRAPPTEYALLIPPHPLEPRGGCSLKTGFIPSTSFVVASPEAIAFESDLIVEWSLADFTTESVTWLSPTNWREKMVESAAESNEEIMDKYLEEGDLSEEDIIKGLRERTLNNEIVPCLCGSAFKNKGVQTMLDAVIDFLPAPNEVKAITGILENEEEGSRESDDEAPFAGIAFKIATDPFVGSLTFVRVYSGTLNTGDSVFLPIKGKKERVGRMLQMHSNKREEISEARAGDICAVIGLKDAITGETFT